MLEFSIIHSPANPRVKEARALLRGGKADSGEFAGEGMQLLTRALHSRLPVRYVLAAEDTASSLPLDVEQLLIEHSADLFAVPGSLFAKISRREMTAGVIFVAEPISATEADLEPNRPILALDRVRNPRNIGAIARTCEAAALGGIVLLGAHVDAFGYEALRASMGSVFGVPIVSMAPEEFSRWTSENGRTLIGTSGAAEQSLWEAELPADSVFLFGNEAQGLDSTLIELCSALVKIPYNEQVDSLNLAASVAVVSFEFRRRNPF